MSCAIHIDNNLRAPDVLFGSDIVGTAQRLAVSQQSKKQFLNVDINSKNISHKLSTSDKNTYGFMYKCIYELLTYLTEKTSTIEINILIENKENKLCVGFYTSEVNLDLLLFNMDNINLYLVKAIVSYMDGDLSVKNMDEDCEIKLSLPLASKIKLKNI